MYTENNYVYRVPCNLTWEILPYFLILSAFAVALGNLYHEELDPSTCDMVGVLASACVLGFTDLQKR